MSEMTEILGRVSDGDRGAAERLLELVYDELRGLAAGYLAHERAGHTLQPTALVHEAYLKMLGAAGGEGAGLGGEGGAAGGADQRAGGSAVGAWRGRAHFFAVAATAMRRVLVDHARRRRAAKRGGAARGGGLGGAALEAAGVVDDGHGEQVLELEELLGRLAALDARKCRVVELRFYAGMTNEEIGEVLGVARSTVAEDWSVARAWLAARLADHRGGAARAGGVGEREHTGRGRKGETA